MHTYLEYRRNLQYLKKEASIRAEKSRTPNEYGDYDNSGEESDYTLFIEAIQPIFPKIIDSSSLTLAEKFRLFTEEYYFDRPAGSSCLFEIFEREKNEQENHLFFHTMLELLNNEGYTVDKTPTVFNTIIYQIFFKQQDFHNAINYFFLYLEKLPLADSVAILKENHNPCCPYAKHEVRVLLDKLWIKGATITDIVAVYQLWLTQEECFALIIKKISQGPWTKKQCQEILDNNPMIITHLINLPNGSQKLEIIEACLEKYKLKNKKLFTLESASLKKIQQEKIKVLSGDLHKDQLLATVIAAPVAHTLDISNMQTAIPEARAISDENNPYLNYELINRTRNTLERVSVLFHSVATVTRVDIPLEVQSYIEKSIVAYKHPETYLDFFYRNRRSEKANFLEELLVHIRHHPNNSYKNCVESFKSLHAKRYNDVITGDNAEGGNVYRIIMTLLSLDNFKAEEVQVRPSAPPLYF